MMKENNCPTIRNNINQYLDGELAEIQMIEFEQHLADCPHCLAIFRDYQFIHNSLKETPRVEVPLELKFKVLENIRASKLKRLRLLNQRIGVGVFLAAALLITIGLRYALPTYFGTMDSSFKPASIEEQVLRNLSTEAAPTILEVANLKDASLELEELLKNLPQVVVESKEIKEKEVFYNIIVFETEMDSFIKELSQFKEKLILAGNLKTKNDGIESGNIYINIKEKIK